MPVAVSPGAGWRYQLTRAGRVERDEPVICFVTYSNGETHAVVHDYQGLTKSIGTSDAGEELYHERAT